MRQILLVLATLAVLGLLSSCHDDPPVIYPTTAPLDVNKLALGPGDKLNLTVFYGSHSIQAAYALDNRDPFTGAQVLSRGLVTGRGGTLAVASPLHKQRFALGTGVCVEDGTTRVEIYRCRVRDGIIEVETPAR